MRTLSFIVGLALFAALASVAPGVLPNDPSPEVCDDGVDNDGDGLTDLQDPDCRDDLVLFPIPEDVPTEADLSDPNEFLALLKGAEYTFDVVSTGESFTNTAGERLPFAGSVSFLGLLGGGVLPLGSELLLVLTSLRQGPFQGGSDPLPPHASAGYLLGSFQGADLAGPPFFVRDGQPGQIIDEEGNVFIALSLPAVAGPVYGFDFELMLVDPLSDPLNLQLFNTAFILITCGNGILDASEQCDDGNRVGGDCCSPTCRLDPDGTLCTDGSVCTEAEVCQGGACIGLPIDCGDSNPCTDDLCDPETGCFHPPGPDGVACDDGEFCTTEDACRAGSCEGGAPKDCSTLDDECSAATCDEAGDTCISQPINEGVACDDGQFCTTGETCMGGVCAGGAPADCSALDDRCNLGICDEILDLCMALTVNEGLTCDDGEFCTTGETCTEGGCGGGAPTDCSALSNQCNLGVCNETLDACEAQPIEEGGACNDGQFCTTGETCSEGTCGGGALRDCSALDDQCNAGVCSEDLDVCKAQPANEDGTCNDGQFCTTGESCTGGVCGGGAPTDCAALDDQCNLGVCDEDLDVCRAQPDNERGACNDGQFCTTGETCTGGVCDGGAPTNCSALSDQCNLGACNETLDACAAQPIDEGGACNDGRFCTTGETCTGGVCDGGAAIDCSTLDDQCNVGTCNETLDACEALPAHEEEPCDDEEVCTVGDTCRGGNCVPGETLDCDDENPCTIDTCGSTTGCVNTLQPDGSACDDGSACTADDTCAEGTCTGLPIDCADGDACTADLCEPESGCVNRFDSTDPACCQDDFDSGDVAVVFSGSGVATDPDGDGKLEVDLRGAARKFYCSHPDEFQFLTFFSSFSREQGESEFPASYQPVKNEILGIGPAGNPGATDFDPDDPNRCYCVFDDSAEYRSDGEPGKLEGVIDMNSLEQYPKGPRRNIEGRESLSRFTTVEAIGQQFGRRWGAYARFSKGEVTHSTDLLGRDLSHWSFFLDSDASVLEGNKWTRWLGVFVSTAVSRQYSALDFYLMGLYSKEEVPEFFYIADPTEVPPGGASSPPYLDWGTLGTRVDVSIEDVIRSLGPRSPDVSTSPKQFRQVFVLLAKDGQMPSAAEIDKVNRFRTAWESWFARRTLSRAEIDTRLR